MSTPNRLTECPTVRVVLFQQADESRGLAAARRFDPADSRRPMPARLGADPGRQAPAAGMASVRYAAPARRLFGASYARIPGRARRARRPLSDRMPRRIAADRPHNCRQA
jgi:hypothetical protein